jgi:autotransporter-associated beta strand protein
MGGSIFVDGTSTLILNAPLAFSGNGVTGGASGAGIGLGASGDPGSAYGPDIFIISGGSLTFNLNNTTVVLSNPIHSDEQNYGSTGGGLFVVGPGTLDLTGSGSHTFTGGLHISGAAAITVSSDAHFGSTSIHDPIQLTSSTLHTTGTITSARGVVLTTSGTFNTDISTVFTINGNISESGASSITKTGAGTLVLNGTNTYTGGITVSAGTLKGTTTGLKGTITNNSAVTFDQDTDGTCTGNITGSGSLAKAGTGALTFSGTLSHTGGTTISAGSIVITTANIQSNITNNAGVTFNQGSDGTYAGNITGTGTLTKLGAGALTLSGVNAYSGGTTVSTGSLIGTTSSVQGDITNNTAVTFNQNSAGTYAGNMSGSGSLTKQGTGNVTLSGTNSHSGGTTVSAGALTGTTASLQGDITNNAAVTFNQSSDGTYAGNMSGSGSLTKLGTGNVTLSGTNSHSGGTTVSAGTLTGTLSSLPSTITNNAAVAFNQNSDGTSTHTITGSGVLIKLGTGTITLNGTYSQTGGTTISAGGLTGTTTKFPGNITNNATLTLSQNSDGTYAGNISGSGALIKLGTGNVMLSGTNSHSGGTTVTAGTLTGTTASLPGNITNNAAVIFNQSTDGTYSGNMSGSGSLTKLGNGNMTLSGTNNHSGGTTVSAGTLTGTTSSLPPTITDNATVAFNQNLDGTSTQTISGSGILIKLGTGTVTLNGTYSHTGGTTVSAGGLTGTTTTMPGTITNNSIVTFDQSTSGTYAGNTTGSGLLVKAGTGAVTLSGTNSHTGGTTISAGSLIVTTSNIQGGITNNAGVTFSQNSDGAYSGNMGGSGSLTKLGTGNVSLSGTNSHTGGTTVTAGTLTGTTTSFPGNITNNAAVAFNQSTDGTYSGNMSGSGSLTKLGTGNVTLSGTYSHSGGTTVSAGTLTGTTSSLPTTITNNANVVFNQNTDTTSTHTITGTGVLIKLGTGTVTLNGTYSYSGGTTVSAGGIKGTTTTIRGDITNNGTVTINQNTTGTYAGNMSGSGALVKQGTGNVTLSGTNTYTGGTTVSAGVLSGTTLSIQGNIVNNSVVYFVQNFDGVYSGNMTGIGAISKLGSGNVTFSGGAFIVPNANLPDGGIAIIEGTLTGTTDSLHTTITNFSHLVFDQSTDGTYAQTLSGSGDLTKIGSGKVILTGDISESNTFVNEGSLFVNTNTMNSPITVASGAKLGGGGTITGDVTLSGTLAPGNSIGTLNVAGDFEFGDNSIYEVEINPTSTDLLNTTGTLTIGNNTTVYIIADKGSYITPVQYLIATGGSRVGDFDHVTFSTPSASGMLSQIGNQVFFILGDIQNAFADVVTRGNPAKVAVCLDSADAPSGSDMAEIISELSFLSVPDLIAALDQLHPAQYKGLILAQEYNTFMIRGATSRRLEELYQTPCNKKYAGQKQWNIWADFSGDWQNQKNGHNQIGYRTQTGGVTLGTDTQIGPHGSIGLLGAYSYSDLQWKSHRGHGRINSGYAGAYLHTHNKYLFASLIGMGAYSHYDAERKIPVFSRHAKNHHSSREALVHFDTGLMIPMRQVIMRPFVGIDTIWLKENAIREKKAGALNLRIDSSRYRMNRYEAGLGFSRCFTTHKGTKWIPDIKGSYVREVRKQGQYYNTNFVGQLCSFNITGHNPTRSLYTLSAGLSIIPSSDHALLSFLYKFERSNSFQNQTGQVQFGYRF